MFSYQNSGVDNINKPKIMFKNSTAGLRFQKG